MNEHVDFHIPDCDEFRRGYEVYNERERRGFVYFEALSIVSENSENPLGMAQGVNRLIRSWNRFFANFDLNGLVNCIDRNLSVLDGYRARDIESLSDNDEDGIKDLFNEFLDALKRTSDNAKSPVSVAKALSLFAPNFLPIWDSNIAFGYNCFYFSDSADDPYFRFCQKMKIIADKVQNFVPNHDDRSLLKRIDEYNYSKYTMHWI